MQQNQNQQQKKQINKLQKSKAEFQHRKDKTSRIKDKSDSNGILSNLFKKRKPPVQTVQDTISYKRILPDGICHVEDKKYNKTIQFFDINYQLAQNDDKTIIFENYCDFLNYFDSSIEFQLSFINQKGNIEDFKKNIEMPNSTDEFNEIREEFSNMLKNQLSKGNNGLIKTKYITFTIEADNLKMAKQRLERIESDILNNFKVLGARAIALDGKERLELLFNILNPDSQSKFNFTWNSIKKGGMSTKDYIVPSSFNFGDRKIFRMGDMYSSTSHIIINAPEMNDRMLADLLDIDESISINFHIYSIDQNKAIKMIKSKQSDLNKMKIEEQKKAVRAGYDMDIIPSDIQTFTKETENFLDDLQNRNERMFVTTITVLNTASTKQKLENTIAQVQSICTKYNCMMKRLDYQQERGLISSLPLGKNRIEIKRTLTTSSTAIFVPFTTQELFMPGESLYYGLNALSNNIIMVDRKALKNPNGLILGVPGAGKSFAAKREITNSFLRTSDDVIVGDPEGEYAPLVNILKGQVINISPKSKDYINPMDINLNYSEDDDPLTLKSDFILSLCELVVGTKMGLDGKEISIIDRCVRLVYRKYLDNPIDENMPILEDLYKSLLAQEEPEAKRIATALEIYVTGSLNVFNHQTNIDIHNRFVCYNFKELGKALKKIGMLIIQDQVWNRVSMNRGKKATRYYIDEFHLLLKEPQTASYSVEIWKRFRKWGGIPTGITQNVKDLLASREIENIFENSEFIYMLSQAAGDRIELAKRLNISDHQLSYVTHTNPGEGLLFFGNVTIPFIDKFPKETILYRVMTTKPEEVSS